MNMIMQTVSTVVIAVLIFGAAGIGPHFAGEANSTIAAVAPNNQTALLADASASTPPNRTGLQRNLSAKIVWPRAPTKVATDRPVSPTSKPKPVHLIPSARTTRLPVWYTEDRHPRNPMAATWPSSVPEVMALLEKNKQETTPSTISSLAEVHLHGEGAKDQQALDDAAASLNAEADGSSCKDLSDKKCIGKCQMINGACVMTEDNAATVMQHRWRNYRAGGEIREMAALMKVKKQAYEKMNPDQEKIDELEKSEEAAITSNNSAEEQKLRSEIDRLQANASKRAQQQVSDQKIDCALAGKRLPADSSWQKSETTRQDSCWDRVITCCPNPMMAQPVLGMVVGLLKDPKSLEYKEAQKQVLCACASAQFGTRAMLGNPDHPIYRNGKLCLMAEALFGPKVQHSVSICGLPQTPLADKPVDIVQGVMYLLQVLGALANPSPMINDFVQKGYALVEKWKVKSPGSFAVVKFLSDMANAAYESEKRGNMQRRKRQGRRPGFGGAHGHANFHGQHTDGGGGGGGGGGDSGFSADE